MEVNDHISVTLSGIAGSEELPSNTPVTQTTRKSLRRSWNQLPRCQRNLIIFGITAACLTLFLFLSSDQVTEENARNFSAGGVLPFQSGPNEGRNEVVANRLVDRIGRGIVEQRQHQEVDKNIVEGDEEPEQIKNEEPQFQELNAIELNRQQANVENVVKLPETKRFDYIHDTLDENVNKVNIQEINANNIEAPAAENNGNDNDDVHDLDAVLHDPEKVPGMKYMTIFEYVNRIDETGDAQKQHFHGATNKRQIAVVAAFKHSWEGYKKYAWGHDNLKPISQSSHDWFGLGLTIVDSLDTMYIMGLEDEFMEARDWVNDFLTFDVNRDVNLFEVTIRVLGGLLASYHLSGDKMFLRKSIELGNHMLPCFLSSSGIPFSDVNLGSMSAHSPKWSPDSSTSEVTTIQLEFRDLSRSTKIPIYEKVVQTVNEKVHALEKNNGLVPIFINANTGTFRNYATISLGARGDSYYEYLLKQWIQTGRKENDFLILDYMRAIDGVLTQLMRRTPREQHVYVGELINGKDFKPKMDHLTCYLPGTLILGHKYGMPDSHLLLARDLLETCYQTYMKQPTQLAPEISYFAVNDNEEHDIYVKPNDAHNLLRPEFIESLYYFYVLTGNRTYQDMGWTIFEAFEKHTKVAAGYTSIGNVKNIFNTRLRDMMESFWMSETLKYFYLLFSDNRNEIDTEKWIFNSEAHPLPIRNH